MATETGRWVRVATLEELPLDAPVGLAADGVRLCLVRTQEGVFAILDRCTHRDFPLSAGEVDAEEGTIACAWHGATFDLRTGAVRALPAIRPVPVYPVEVRDGEVWVCLTGA
ncbi:MAG TPA: non-heme iron oxygenase ferredoxin subunit [Chloroflexota bacterium]